MCVSGCWYSLGDPIPTQSDPVMVDSLAEYNLVLLTVDALPVGSVGCYGDANAQTPSIDALAADGLRFTDAYANSSFLGQSLSTLLSGRLPTAGGTIDILGAHPHDETTTLALHFRASGRATALMGNQPLLKSQGFTQGYEDVSIGASKSEKTASAVTDDALMFVDDIAGDPFFLHVHYSDPHEPYGDGSSPETVRAVRENYAAYASNDEKRKATIAELKQKHSEKIAAVDAAVGELMAGLEERGVMDRTAILFTATHGEEFWEHKYVGHAWTLYDEVIAVPLILYAPGRVPAATANSTVSHADVLPSLRTLFELERNEEPIDGVTMLVPEDAGYRFEPTQSNIISELVLRDRCVLRAVISEGWKYIAAQDWPNPNAREAILGDPRPIWAEPERELLFNLREDPNELLDLSSTSADRLALLRAALAEYEAQCPEHGVPPRDLTDAMEIGDTEDRESLETLGYL
jgi:arylsulfatase A-like enzyme